MIINHNLMANNAIRNMNINSGNASKSMQKLSSGLRINNAADDAAGLAISEKMRGQIRGLDQASSNAQDGISLLQTGEGALNETQSILQRMRELAVQSSTDTNTTTDRSQIQKEVNQLAQEIGRIGNTTEFNTQKLLDGSFSGTFQIGANENQNLTVAISDMRSFALGVAGKAELTNTGTYAANAGTVGDTLGDGTYSVADGATAGSYVLKDSSGAVVAKSTDGLTYTTQAADGSAGDDTLVFTQAVTSGSVTVATDASGTTTYKGTAQFTNTGLQAGSYTYEDATKTLKDNNGTIVASSADGITFKGNVNGTSTTVFTATVALTDKDAVNVGGINVSDQSSANSAITTINNALETVSTQRANLGAYQNRLEHTIANLGTSSENLTSSESRIRDVDMAKEMSTFSKNNILAQAAQAMLAQANNQPQQVLQLLR
ncbi:flagellin [Clostridium pasteurianum]|uniref:flagellin N-terminal helical domain-containing protein n=1 Tax=Clostridium pasteurianum TaxID=1501 RepID=UPI00226083FF|nr:flagellin [Clostridium pasteurianum]UZW16008.1 flagellin [Clostridium pasteurianum]